VLLTFEPRDHDDTQPMSGGERDPECKFCTFLFSEDCDGENWNRCSVCFEWSHALGASLKDEVLIRDMCK